MLKRQLPFFETTSLPYLTIGAGQCIASSSVSF